MPLDDLVILIVIGGVLLLSLAFDYVILGIIAVVAILVVRELKGILDKEKWY
jgi:hypothetical protein